MCFWIPAFEIVSKLTKAVILSLQGVPHLILSIGMVRTCLHILPIPFYYKESHSASLRGLLRL
jgi:hypothetical protein